MITVLLSTYNSERFLREQIDSILGQKDVELNLLVRDDGSKDKTFDILNEYQSQGKLKWYSDGQNMKPARGFMKLLADAPADSDYYAFSDHDDVWLDDKLSAALEALRVSPERKPALYFCQTKLVDENLKPFKKQIIIRPYCTLGETLTYHFIGGCTMVFNKALRDIVVAYSPKFLDMHDIWIYLIAQSVGANIFFDPTPHILYRQHGNNAVGQGYGLWKSLKKHYKRLIVNKEHIRQRMAQEALQGYSSLMPEENRRMIQRFADYDKNPFTQFRLLFSSKYECSSKRTYILFKIATLLRTL